MPFQESELGFRYEDSTVGVFFGKALATRSLIENEFPDIQFMKVQQTHSDVIVHANTNLQTADAHWTQEKKTALLISTADCMPILIYNNATKTVAAVHAGWKGVCNQITVKSLKALSTENSTASDFEIWIGPHIMPDSFEVKSDVLNQLLAASYESDKTGHFTNGDSIRVDLKDIVLSQITASIGSGFKLFEVNLDTLTTACLHSYRRDKENSGRNLSFIYPK